MSSAPSYKKIVGQLEAFAEGHFIIRKFSFGEETDYDLEKEGEYPAMHVLHPSVSLEPGVINYNLTIQFADLPRDIETKTRYQMEQISDLFRIGQDLLNVIAQNPAYQLFGEEAEIIGTPTMDAAAQETKNNLVVVTLSFTLQLPNDWSACDVPADWTIGAGGGGSNSLTSNCCDVTQVVYKHLQVAHGFSVGEVIYVSADGTFALAQADNIATSYVAGFVIEVPNANTFRYVTHGTVTVGVPAFAGGTLMYLSATTPGALTNVAPTSPDIVRPVMMVVDNGSQGIVFLSLVDSSASSGTVTSVDLTMPPAFAVSGNPITGAGTLAVAGAGVASQYVRGDGTLANFPSSSGGGASTSYYLNGSVNQGVFGGNTYYEMNRTPIFGPGTNFNISTNGYIASFITDANDPSQLLIPAGTWNFEMFFSASSGGGNPRFYVELYKYDGVTFTLIASSSATPEGITGGTAIDAYLMPLAVPATTLALTDRLAVRVYVNNSGRTITLHTEGSNLCQVITTFTTGITALNGLTDQVQNLNTGTSGSDFGISSAGNTHTFNLPVASATNTGKLSNTDWSSFNARIPLAGTSPGNPVTGTIQWEDTDEESTYPKVLFYQDDIAHAARFEVLRVDGGGFYLRQYNLSDLNEFIQIAFDSQANLKIEKFNSGPDWAYVFQSPSIEDASNVALIINIKKRFWTKAGTPTTTDDNTKGFVVGTVIWDTTNSILYHCTDDTTNAAVWRQVGPVITSGTAAPSGGNDGDIYLQYV